MTDLNSIFETTMKELWAVAMQDGKITPEEKDILEQVQIDADSYSLMLQECMEDGKITKEEFDKLEYLKHQMLSRADLIANIDAKLEDDEKALVNKLVEVVNAHYKLDIS